MDLSVFPDHETLSQFAAELLAAELKARPTSLLCLATGATPIRAYELLAERRFADPGLFDRVRILKLDEWLGLTEDDPASCEKYLRRSLIDVLALDDRYIGFLTNPVAPRAECDRIKSWLERHGPIDVCVLGLGVNGHLGFNEPAPDLLPHAHVANLSRASLGHAMLEQSLRQPTHGLTLGMADLLQARRIVLLVSGPAKQGPLFRLRNGPISTEFPASFLLLRSDVTILCDAASCPDL